MSDIRYAVYIVAVEDTEENDIAIADLYGLTFDRLGGNMTEQEALDAVMEVPAFNWDRAPSE